MEKEIMHGGGLSFCAYNGKAALLHCSDAAFPSRLSGGLCKKTGDYFRGIKGFL